jgi:hydroxymethylbilane synthase
MHSPRIFRLGTRGSQLALYQAQAVAARLAETGGPPCEIVVIRTSGDQLQLAPLSEVGGKRLFVKEIEDALLKGEIDLAVHSSKDMPALLPEDLSIAGVLPRADPLDAVVLPGAAEGPGISTEFSGVDELVAIIGQTPSIGTSSVRRIAQLKRLLPGASFKPIRGNLDTRLRKLDSGEYDAIVLAAAGLRRLGFGSRISFALPVTACVPAPGQGIIAIEIRDGDSSVREAITAISDPLAAAALDAERCVVDALGGGCQTPIGALATAVGDDEMDLVAAVIALDGSRIVRAADRGSRSDASSLGRRVATQLIENGALDILEESRRVQGAVEGIQP